MPALPLFGKAGLGIGLCFARFAIILVLHLSDMSAAQDVKAAPKHQNTVLRTPFPARALY
jgi:hypothetical protein